MIRLAIVVANEQRGSCPAGRHLRSARHSSLLLNSLCTECCVAWRGVSWPLTVLAYYVTEVG